MLYVLSCRNLKRTLEPHWAENQQTTQEETSPPSVCRGKHHQTSLKQNWTKLNPGPEEVLALLQSTYWSHLHFPPEIIVLESRLQEQIQISGWKFNNSFQSELQSVGWCLSSYSGCLLKLLIECLVLLEELEGHENTFCSRGLTIIDIFKNYSWIILLASSWP